MEMFDLHFIETRYGHILDNPIGESIFLPNELYIKIRMKIYWEMIMKRQANIDRMIKEAKKDGKHKS